MQPKGSKPPSLISAISPYKSWILLLIVITIGANALNLFLPKLIAQGIDSFTSGTYSASAITPLFIGIAVVVFILTYLQGIVQTYISEIAARDFRTKLIEKISQQPYAYIQKATPEKLLTNITSDTDSIKQYIAMAIPSIVSSISLIVGSSILLLITDWKLALIVLSVIPIIGGAFFYIISRVRALFKVAQEIIDRLNKVINESILGSALIRIVYAQDIESVKFADVNARARDLGLKILNNFAALIPIITFVSSMASLVILLLGGKFVIEGSMTLGNLAAFNTYLSLLIFPIIMIGFMTNMIAQASASYTRIIEVLSVEDLSSHGSITDKVTGTISVKNLTLQVGEKYILKDVSFTIKPQTRTAIIGPTGSGKSQLLYLLCGLIEATSGTILYDDTVLEKYDKNSLLTQIGLVFEDSVIFNMSFHENIAFSEKVKEETLEKAIKTAELEDFINSLPDKLQTVASERGTSLSGGQKQRLMLARALAIDPTILFLDDFTARVDTKTEQKILANVKENYPQLTLISVTQKITSVEEYDQILVMMEGELIAQGTHHELLKSSPEYVQIYNSQRSTNNYELRTE